MEQSAWFYKCCIFPLQLNTQTPVHFTQSVNDIFRAKRVIALHVQQC